MYEQILELYNSKKYFLDIINDSFEKISDEEINELLNKLYLLDEKIIFNILLHYLTKQDLKNKNIMINFLETHKIKLDITNNLAKPDKTIFEHSEELVEKARQLLNLHYINEEIFNKLITANAYHDIGKCNTSFQNRIKNGKKFNKQIEVYHNIISSLLIDKKYFKTKEDYLMTLLLVLNHHHYENNLELLNDKDINEIINNIVPNDYINKINPMDKVNIAKRMNFEETIFLLGLLYKCDYAASSNAEIEYINDYLEDKLNNLIKSWKIKNPDADWNEMQMFCKNNKNENIIVIAQTGMGKTEGALNWIGNNKGFFFLPLRSAINAMYLRIKDVILNNEKIDTRLSLLHSDILPIYSEVAGEEIDLMHYYNETKQFSMPLNISTVDQLFNFVFLYPGYELKLATLSYSKIVIDEIQMYDPELLACLITGLEKLNGFGTKIAIVTATLPPFIKDMLTEKIDFKIESFTTNLKRHKVKVLTKKLEAEDIYNFYVEKGKDKKTLVICNTVKKSQKLYDELKNKYGLTNVKLLHSKFIKSDRQILEKEILKDGETEYQDDLIWIATQIVEASLDIDFDYGFSELSEISALFQRMGRVNRKGKKDISDYNFFVYTEIDENLLNKVVDEDLYDLSKKAILTVDGILTEKEKMDLINTYMTTDNIKSSLYYSKYKQKKQELSVLETYELSKAESELRNIEAYTVIPLPVYESKKVEILSLIDEYRNEEDNINKKIILNKIMNYTLSVRKNEKRYNKKDYVVGKIELSEFVTIDILDCEYDCESGHKKK